MGNFSKTPSDVLQASLNKNYVGVYIEQGVPVLDRDLNLMQDIITRTLRSVLSRFIGDCVASGSNSFAIQALPDAISSNNFRILAGAALVNGIDVTNAANLNYSDQTGVPALTTPTGIILPDTSLTSGLAPAALLPILPETTTRTDSVYLDVSLAEVSGTQDAELLNSGDVGLQTSVRQKVVWVVRVAEGAVTTPLPAAGHTHFPLARLVRVVGEPRIQAGMITDLRKQIFSLAQVDELLRILITPAFAPTPNQFNPKFGAPGTLVTLFGNNFNVGAVSVRFGTVTATVNGTPTATQISTNVPTMPTGQVKITVQTAGGSVTSIDNFSVT
jgi:hypothetical protein